MTYLRFLARYLLIALSGLGIFLLGTKYLSHSSVTSEKIFTSNLSAHRGVNGEFIIPIVISSASINKLTSANLARSDSTSWQAEKSPVLGGGVVVPIPGVRSHSYALKEVHSQTAILRIQDSIHTDTSKALSSGSSTP